MAEFLIKVNKISLMSLECLDYFLTIALTLSVHLLCNLHQHCDHRCVSTVTCTSIHLKHTIQYSTL